MEELPQLLATYYLSIKTIHLLAVGMWTFSTAVAFQYYLVPDYRAWRKNSNDKHLLAARNEAMERFDRGVKLEHWAFPLVILTGLLMVWAAGWSVSDVNWLTVKIGIVLVIFMPMEIVDYYISHFGGNKEKIRIKGDETRYEMMMLWHWKFFKITTPIVVTIIPLTYFLAVTKPL